MTTKYDDETIKSFAQEISRYIAKRPNAAETVEGVSKWWLARQRFEDSIEIVQLALDYLVDRDVLIKRSVGNKTLYMRA